MVKEELVRRSPVRLLEQVSDGGVGKGNIGVVSARKGVGKTACMVHLAVDQLIQGKSIIHVSFSDNADHVIAWYDDIFAELSRRFDLDSARRVHDEAVRHRIIMNFTQDGLHITGIRKSVQSMIENSGLKPHAIFVDGYDFSLSSVDEIQKFRSFAQELGAEVWFSASVKELPQQHGNIALPEELVSVVDELDVVIGLRPAKDLVELVLLKDHDARQIPETHLKLDSRSLLIVEES